MIAQRLVLWHNYSNGVAFDLSENRNHGELTAVHRGTGPFATWMQFSGGPSMIAVRPSPTLAELRTLRAQVTFHWDPSAPNDRRHNLIEGHLSFALFVNPDGSLQGTVRSQVAGWVGAKTAAGVVSQGHRHTAEMVHDGISSVTLYLDGHLIAQDFLSPGPVQSVGPHGIAIGHWPEPDGRYTLEGYIELVRVWCDDPAKDATGLVDGCCIDRAAIDQLPPIEGGPIILLDVDGDEVGEVAALSGLDDQQLGEMVRGMLDIGREAASYAARGSKANRDHVRSLGQQGLAAWAGGDQQALQDVLVQANSLMQTHMPPAVAADLLARAQSVLAPMPMTADLFAGHEPDAAEMAQWFGPWCLSSHLPPRPKTRATGPAVDLSTDAAIDGPDGAPFPADGDEHEPVPPPPPPPEEDR